MSDDAMQHAQLTKIRAEIRKLSAESDRLIMETRWYPLILAAGLIGGIAAVMKLFV